MEELQLRLLEKQLMTKLFYFGAKRPYFLNEWQHHQKNVIALNMYIGTNVSVYERCLVLKAFTISYTHIAYACESKITKCICVICKVCTKYYLNGMLKFTF